MASANSTFTELVSTTYRKHRSAAKDNLSNRNALVKRLKAREVPADGAVVLASRSHSNSDALAIGADSLSRLLGG